jgi:predicted nucleotidyltransferase
MLLQEKSRRKVKIFIYFLEDLLGLEVDLVMIGAIKDELKDTILKEVQYV